MNKFPKLQSTQQKNRKPKILLLSDDLRMHSGIGTMSHEFVFGTLQHYDWVQLGAAIKHQEHGKIIDISQAAAKETGVQDASLKIYAHNGYGNEQVLKEIIKKEKPDAILHFTDPRFWGWLYQIEHEIRQDIPLMYYNIWDDLPYPHWNEPFYESCDLLMNISRQTQNIVKNVLQKFPKPDWAVQWVPHGINENNFHPINDNSPEWEEFRKFETDFKNQHDVDFVIFWNNRNIRRKQPGDLILAFNRFCKGLPDDVSKKCALLMHTAIVDPNGTDLQAVKKAVCPDYNVIFSTTPVEPKYLNFMYNMADVTVNIGSNEGFGLSGAESLMAGTMIINNTTGGLQDHCRFEDENGDWIEFSTEFPSNHAKKYTKCGEWAIPVFPSNRSLQGSPQTPYIFDDRSSYIDVSEAMRTVFDLGKQNRDKRGLAGHKWVSGDEANMSARRMSFRFIECIDACLANWTPRTKVQIHKIKPEQPRKFETVGVIND